MLLDYSRNLKIADFGVARVEAQNPKDMTGETGTLGYMAPEDFYEDLFEELSKYGELESMNICDNLADHMVSVRASKLQQVGIHRDPDMLVSTLRRLRIQITRLGMVIR
ncbi:hypothetical protein POM88_052614 [Heracleum sosnowskyi]|uniref:Protein kinase domain-containing protein n=1 Tax=Heracleum sosnowskyi TaxID=360622 RepID=A0AAD8GQK0_9APIA|nr:hypothetical protein POM88_052614 [Heracleum sosnowskyi]